MGWIYGILKINFFRNSRNPCGNDGNVSFTHGKKWEIFIPLFSQKILSDPDRFDPVRIATNRIATLHDVANRIATIRNVVNWIATELRRIATHQSRRFATSRFGRDSVAISESRRTMTILSWFIPLSRLELFPSGLSVILTSDDATLESDVPKNPAILLTTEPPLPPHPPEKTRVLYNLLYD
jgi:hypothetical protein